MEGRGSRVALGGGLGAGASRKDLFSRWRTSSAARMAPAPIWHRRQLAKQASKAACSRGFARKPDTEREIERCASRHKGARRRSGEARIDDFARTPGG